MEEKSDHPTLGVRECYFILFGLPLTNKTLFTDKISGDRSYYYYGDKGALSKNGSGNTIATRGIEVFQVML